MTRKEPFVSEREAFEDMSWGEREDHLLDEHQWDPVPAGRGDPDEHASAHRAGQLVWREHAHAPARSHQ